MDAPFWMVWSPRGGSPKYKHPTLDTAQVEAKRLSQKFNGRHFYVLECVGVAMEGPEIPTEKQAARAARLAAKESDDLPVLDRAPVAALVSGPRSAEEVVK